MSPDYFAHVYPGIWDAKLEAFRVLAIPDGSGWVDISFINDNSIRVGITPAAAPGAYKDVWLYDNFETALASVYSWAVRRLTGEPYGWVRHPATGRRRINGDHRQEHHQP